MRSAHALRFVGVDGEGVDRPDGQHDYVMLSVGSSTLWNAGRQLALGEILSFLWECFLNTPDACFVGFFLGYDFVQWEKLLPERQAYLLLSNAGIKERTSQRRSRLSPFPDPVVVDPGDGRLWEIDIMAGRRFKLRPHRHRKSSFSDGCRNRTCDDGSLVGEFYVADIVGELVPGELEWAVDESLPALEFTGWPSIAKDSCPEGWLYVCDTGSFWQTSFVSVVDPGNWGDAPVLSGVEFATIVEGKAGRSRVVPYGEVGYFEEMVKYNILENDVLARVSSRLNEGFMNDAIPIRIKRNEFYGPGRAAQTWMDMLHGRVADPEASVFNRASGLRSQVGSPDRHNETGILNADVYSSMPAWFADAARASYYGGWFEQFVHGHCDTVWEYDINSAYPFIIASLPCLHTTGKHTGRYLQGTGPDYPSGNGWYVLLHAEFSGSDPHIGCLPFRTRQGNILRPRHLRGWYWAHEVAASQRAGLIDEVSVSDWVAFRQCDCSPPFNPADIGIERMYELRLQVGKNSPAGKAFKLVYNSAYGKTAQSVGQPKYANPVYASLITAGCRTLILDAIATHPERSSAVTMVATDGVYFTSRHPGLRLSSSRLGDWDEGRKTGMTQFMPGVYWDDVTRDLISEGGVPKLKSRGVNARDLAKQIDILDEQFALAHFALSRGDDYFWPTITFTQSFLLISAKLALQRGKWNNAGHVLHNAQRNISADPRSKRQNRPYRDPSTGIVRTRPYEAWDILDTSPYNKHFGMERDTDDDELYDRDGRDGLAYFRDLLNN